MHDDKSDGELEVGLMAVDAYMGVMVSVGMGMVVNEKGDHTNDGYEYGVT